MLAEARTYSLASRRDGLSGLPHHHNPAPNGLGKGQSIYSSCPMGAPRTIWAYTEKSMDIAQTHSGQSTNIGWCVPVSLPSIEEGGLWSNWLRAKRIRSRSIGEREVLAGERMQRLYERLGCVRCGIIEHLDEGDPDLVYFKQLFDNGPYRKEEAPSSPLSPCLAKGPT